jgi:hypothetical protein
MNSDLEVNGNLLFTAGKLAINGNTLHIKNTVTNTASGGIRGSSSSNLAISGGLTSPSLSFDQSTVGTSNLLNNLTINSNSQTAILSSAVIVGGSLNLTDGWIQTTATNSLTMTAAAVFTGGAGNSFVTGPLSRNTNAASDYVYPLGKTGQYDPITITPVSTTTGIYTAEYFPVSVPAATIEPLLTGLATDEYWNISKTSGPDAYVTLLYHDDNTWSPGSPNAQDLIVVAGLNAGTWTHQNGDVIPGNTGTGPTPLKSKLQTAFSSFTYGFGQTVSLPLTLLSFSGKRVDPVIQLAWRTTAEYNVSHFEIERSGNGLQFVTLAMVDATNEAGDKMYHLTDSLPFPGFNYYRLKMVDIDGVFTYSPVIQITPINTAGVMLVYPNPVSGQILYFLSPAGDNGLFRLNLYNYSGQRVFTRTIDSDGGSSVKTIILDRSVQPGAYYLEVTGPKAERKIFRLLIQ